jgi:hypothetical protein
MSVNLTKMAESVRTEVDFLQFAKALLADWEDEEAQLKANPELRLPYMPGPNGWENGNIGGFLSGMIRWAEDVNHSREYDAPPDWSMFAFMLLAGSRYE